MKSDFKELRLRQLVRTLAAFDDAKNEARPQRGWLRAVRESLGMSLENVAQSLGTDRRRIMEFEDAEAKDRITLHSLRRVAAALDCELVYAIVPKSGSIAELARRREALVEQRARASAIDDVLDVKHTMALEGQATGDVNQLIDKETKRRLK